MTCHSITRTLTALSIYCLLGLPVNAATPGPPVGVDRMSEAEIPAIWEALLTNQGGMASRLLQQEAPVYFAAKQLDRPVRSCDRYVPVATYKGKTATCIVIYNQSIDTRAVVLDIHWEALGLDRELNSLYAPPLERLGQESSAIGSDQLVVLPPASGRIFLLDNTPRSTGPGQQPHKLEALLTSRERVAREMFEDTKAEPWRARVGKGTIKTGAGRMQILTQANCHAFMEREILAGATAFLCRLDGGSDQGLSWGPGLGLVWPNAEAHIYVNRRSGGQCGVVINGKEQLSRQLKTQNNDFLILLTETDYRILAQDWKAKTSWELASGKRSGALKAPPALLRAGKLGLSAIPADHSDPGEGGSCTIEEVSIYR